MTTNDLPMDGPNGTPKPSNNIDYNVQHKYARTYGGIHVDMSEAHDKKEGDKEQVQLPEEVRKRFQLEKEEEEQTRKTKDVKQNIDTQSCPGPRPLPKTETGNSANGCVQAKCEVEGEGNGELGQNVRVCYEERSCVVYDIIVIHLFS
jgi:hypothetical protein